MDGLRENRAALRSTLLQLGFSPRKNAGQNFLLDVTVAQALVDAAEVIPTDQVLEIGPGLGAVTNVLLERRAHVIAVEVDRALAQFLSKRYGHNPSIRIISANVLTLRLEEYVRDGGYKVVASLPFNITSRVVRNFLEQVPRPRLLSLLVQKEVAERIAASPGHMSLLSVACQYLGKPEYIEDVPRSSFWPEPEVDAAIIRINVRPLPPEQDRRLLFRIARIGFSARRKMLSNNLEAGLGLERGSTKKVLTDLGLDAKCRAQDLPPDQWKRLSQKLLDKGLAF